eukprot:m.110769 g.110769  ORF g.110769 m.110769 type:complete len:223 (+) comp16076_c0_seq3:140-808(+)
MAAKFVYFKLRGRGEPIRLALAAAGAAYTEEAPDYATMKASAGSADYPFGQAPVFIDGDVTIAQMDAILRHLGRKHDLYGSSLPEAALIDSVMIGVESIRSKYTSLIYTDKLAEDAKKVYATAVIDKSTIKERNGGAHFYYLDQFLERSSSHFVVGDKLSIADLQLFDLVDLHLRDALFPTQMRETFPKLAEHHDRIAAIKEIAAYLGSEQRPSKINGSELG